MGSSSDNDGGHRWGDAGVGPSASYEVQSFPISQHQAQLLTPDTLRERLPASELTLGEMPSSPVQISILTPRHPLDPTQIAARLAARGYSEVHVLMPSAYQVSAMRNGVPVVLTVDMRTGKTK